MKTTTIALTQEVKEEISSFGIKGETYSEILMRLVVSAKERQLRDLLMNEDDTITAREALARAKKRWHK